MSHHLCSSFLNHCNSNLDNNANQINGFGPCIQYVVLLTYLYALDSCEGENKKHGLTIELGTLWANHGKHS
jgi:hypothetical protein